MTEFVKRYAGWQPIDGNGRRRFGPLEIQCRTQYFPMDFRPSKQGDGLGNVGEDTEKGERANGVEGMADTVKIGFFEII